MKGLENMDGLSKWTNDELTSRMDKITREIKNCKNYRRDYTSLQAEYEAIKKEVLRRMSR